MRNRLIVSGIAVLMLAACGGGGGSHGKFVNACMGEGESKESCTCFADIAKEELSTEAFTAFADAAATDNSGGLENLPPEDAAKMVMIVLQAGQKCELSSLGGL